MTCKTCGIEYEKWHDGIPNGLCLKCNEAAWTRWESEEEADNLKLIAELVNQGHPHHCACRQIFGDGECECDLYKKGYDPYSWMKGGDAREPL